MKKIIKVLVGVSLFATIFTPNIKIENTTNSSLIEYASDNFNKGKVDIKRLENVSDDTSYVVGPTMYVQMGENETSKFLRFATPIKGNPNKVEYTRTYDKDGTKDQKSKEVITVYPGIRSGEKDFYYNDDGLIDAKPETLEYYWACYTIEFKGEKAIEKFLTIDFTLELKVNDNEVKLSRTSCLYENYSSIILNNDNEFEWFVGKTKTNDFAGKTISLNYERSVDVTEVLYPDTSLRFNGTFDGKGNKLNLNLEKENTVALFGYVGNEGSVKNLTTTGIVKATDTSVDSDVAGIASINYGTIDTCTNEAKIDVQGIGYGGGIVSQNAGGAKIINCTNNGDIGKYNETGLTEGGFMLGGIAGRSNQDSLIENCKNYGTILGKASGNGTGGVGGIAGVIAGATISNCENGHAENETKNLTSTGGNLGGIVGSIQYDDSIISGCKNYMDVNGGQASIGGILGYIGGKFIYNSTSKKNENVDIKGIELKNCDNYGNITTTDVRVGGIAGRLSGTGSTQSKDKTLIMVDGCYNFGNIASTKVLTDNKNYVGGLFGTISNVTIKNSRCYNEVLISYGNTKDIKVDTLNVKYSSNYNKYKRYVFMLAGYGNGTYVNMESTTTGLCDKDKKAI